MRLCYIIQIFCISCDSLGSSNSVLGHLQLQHAVVAVPHSANNNIWNI